MVIIPSLFPDTLKFTIQNVSIKSKGTLAYGFFIKFTIQNVSIKLSS